MTDRYPDSLTPNEIKVQGDRLAVGTGVVHLDLGETHFVLTAGQARDLAAALVKGADWADTLVRLSKLPAPPGIRPDGTEVPA